MFRVYRRLAALLLFALLAARAPLPAWDAPGHEVIAVLAGDRLNPRARNAVSDLARQIATPGPPYDSITMACWMDDLRRNDLALPQHGLFLTWHYIDIGIDPGDPVPSFQPGDDNPFRGNVVQALKRAYVVLQGGTDPYITSKAMACAMMMHLVGDIHQPLHAATHYFQSAGGWLHHDAGGNKEYVVNGPPDDPRFSLHYFWDSAWRASFDDTTGCVMLDARYQESSQDPPAIRLVAEEIARMPQPSADLQPNFEQWAKESNQLAQSFVYPDLTATESKKYCRLSSAYVTEARRMARQRLFLAAERLAVVLNETLGDATPRPAPTAYPAGPAGQSYQPGP